MEDVIFNGTDTVDPINMAEVSLTLSNEDRSLSIDYDEVTITRRLFRSGESEYVLNKTQVRLKDISGLLMGTGIGTDSYSIIEQGKIDLILSSKPEERRFIFEEASGITRYKTKKKEALRKLEHTENNLVRIGDIINEVKRQINSIERHARKAERYKGDFEVMKEMDLKLAYHETRRIENGLSQSKTDLDRVSQKENTLTVEINEETSLIDKYRDSLENTIRELTEIQQKLSEVTLFIDKSRHKIEMNKERASDLANFKEQAEVELNRLEERLKSQTEEIEGINERLDKTLKTKEEKEKALIEKEESARELGRQIDVHQKETKATKTKSLDILAFQTKTKNELIKLGADLSNRKTRLRRLDVEKRNVEEEKNKAGEFLREAEAALNSCREKVRLSSHLLEGLRERLSSSERTLEDKQKCLRESQDAHNTLQSKEDILKEMIQNYEGFEKGVKLACEAAKEGRLAGIAGLIAEIIEPKEGYESALEAALGEKSQAIVVENRNALSAIFHFLKENKAQARLLIKEDLQAQRNHARQRIIMQSFGLPELSSFVRVEPSFEAISNYLLDNIYIADDIESACRIYGLCNEDVKFVTRDGHFLERGHVRGGWANEESATSVIGRSNRLESIRMQREALRSEMEKLTADETREKKGIEGLKREITLSGEGLKNEEITLANALTKKETVNANYKKIDDEVSIISLEIDEVSELVHEISLKGEDLNNHLNDNEREHEKSQAFISESQEAVQKKTKLKNDLTFEISDLKTELAFMATGETEARKALAKETSLHEEVKLQGENKRRDIFESQEKIDALEAEGESLQKDVGTKKAEEGLLKSKLAEISEYKEALSSDLRKNESLCREKEKSLGGLRDHVRNLEIRQKESELMAINISDRIRQAYKLDIRTLEMQIDEESNWEDMKNQVEVLKIKLEKLGPVNLVAIEEHKELEERYSFLTQQQEDLLRAKDSLHKAIIKINKTTKQLFIETFEKIQIEFKNYFRMLFGGGHAELLLLDESDVLESGIEIVVRPPGKKLQNLLLLSGGEKALTAIALLFAIFKVKPSPFCILDEVDAPLDESNIGRFTRILQEFLKTSQFIIITHNKRTMQMANILYGITMEKKGISKIVSVKFADDKKDESEEGAEVLA